MENSKLYERLEKQEDKLEMRKKKLKEAKLIKQIKAIVQGELRKKK